MIKTSLHYLSLGILATALSGCFHVGMHIKDNILTSPGMDKSIRSLPYNYHSVRGPNGLALSNNNGLHANLDFDLIGFPDRFQWDELNLDSAQGEKLREKTIRLVRNYFGSSKKIFLVAYKTVAIDHQTHSYLLDARNPEMMETLGEMLIKRGLYRVLDRDLAKNSDHKHLLKLENEAQRSRLGIWKHASILNPNWRD
jgi:hypothetical protein